MDHVNYIGMYVITAVTSAALFRCGSQTRFLSDRTWHFYASMSKKNSNKMLAAGSLSSTPVT